MTLWRPMEPVDLEEVHSIADRTHPDHPEDFAVLAERRQLFPDGCKVLDRDGAIVGYAISHPWLFGAPPALNSLLELCQPNPIRSTSTIWRSRPLREETDAPAAPFSSSQGWRRNWGCPTCRSSRSAGRGFFGRNTGLFRRLCPAYQRNSRATVAMQSSWPAI